MALLALAGAPEISNSQCAVSVLTLWRAMELNCVALKWLLLRFWRAQQHVCVCVCAPVLAGFCAALHCTAPLNARLRRTNDDHDHDDQPKRQR